MLFGKSRALADALETQRKANADADRSQSGPRMDDALPLGIKVGGLIGFEPSFFYTQQKKHGAISRCPDGERVVEQYGRLPLHGGMTQHRFYLSGEEGFVLRVVTDGKVGVVEDETVLFVQAEEHSPTKPSEWSQWLGGPSAPPKPGQEAKAPESVIGFQTFVLDTGQTFWRLIDADHLEDGSGLKTSQIRPMVGHETLFTDPYNVRGDQVERQFMFYYRWAEKDPTDEEDGTFEYLTVSSVNCSDGSWVEALVGLPVQHSDLVIT